MSSADLWLGLLLSVIIVCSTTANMSIRHFPRVRLSEWLEKRRREHLLARLAERRVDLLIVTATIRLVATLGLVLIIMDAVLETGSGNKASDYGLIFLLSLLLVMILGVAIPNAWARYGGDAFLGFTLPVWLGLRVLLMPVLLLHRLVDATVRRLAGVPVNGGLVDEADQIEREILDVVSEGELSGAVHEDDAEMIESVMELRTTDVAEIMTPRTEITALPATASLAEAKELIAVEGHSRIPVFDENIDDIKGVLYAKDLLSLTNEDPFDPLKMMRKVPFVPETKRVTDLLQELREKKVHLAIVLDEYGGTAGLVTIEDILEEIVGEIADEYEAPEPEPIQRIDDTTLDIDARVHIDELNDELKVELPEDEDYDTVGGFLFSKMGKIPLIGEEFLYQNVRFRIVDAEERKINRLRVEVVQADEPAREKSTNSR